MWLLIRRGFFVSLHWILRFCLFWLALLIFLFSFVCMFGFRFLNYLYFCYLFFLLLVILVFLIVILVSLNLTLIEVGHSMKKESVSSVSRAYTTLFVLLSTWFLLIATKFSNICWQMVKNLGLMEFFVHHVSHLLAWIEVLKSWKV